MAEGRIGQELKMLLTAAATYPMLGWESDKIAFTVLGTVMHTGTVCISNGIDNIYKIIVSE